MVYGLLMQACVLYNRDIGQYVRLCAGICRQKGPQDSNLGFQFWFGYLRWQSRSNSYTGFLILDPIIRREVHLKMDISYTSFILFSMCNNTQENTFICNNPTFDTISLCSYYYIQCVSIVKLLFTRLNPFFLIGIYSIAY